MTRVLFCFKLYFLVEYLGTRRDIPFLLFLFFSKNKLRSTLHEDMRKNNLYIFVHNDLDLSPLDLKFAPQLLLS